MYKYYDNVLSKEECEYLIEYSKDKFETATTHELKQNSFRRKGKVAWITPESGEEYNNIARKVIDLMFYESKESHLQELSQIENLQIAEYKFLDHYNKHIDLGTTGNYRILSGVVELSNPKDYIGGGLEIFISDKKFSIPLKQGSVVFFPSILTHRAKPVFYGSRYSMSLWGHKK
jgi:PKHD-type hydroxylase